MIRVALAAGGLIELQRARRGCEGGKTASGRSAAVGLILVLYFRGSAGMTDHAAVGIAQFPAFGKDGLHHATMACTASGEGQQGAGRACPARRINIVSVGQQFGRLTVSRQRQREQGRGL